MSWHHSSFHHPIRIPIQWNGIVAVTTNNVTFGFVSTTLFNFDGGVYSPSLSSSLFSFLFCTDVDAQLQNNKRIEHH